MYELWKLYIAMKNRVHASFVYAYSDMIGNFDAEQQSYVDKNIF
jgi:hypothetical protein